MTEASLRRSGDLTVAPTLPQPRSGVPDLASVATLCSYGLDESVLPDRAVSAAARLASKVTGAPTAAVNVLTDTELVLLATQGTRRQRVPRSLSLCHLAVTRGEAVVMVPDASRDPLFAANPLVNGELGNVRYYVSVPLLAYDRTVIGTVCAMSDDPARGDTSEEAQQSLLDVATIVSEALEARRERLRAQTDADRDHLTGLPNRRAVERRLELDLSERDAGYRPADSIVVLLIDLVGFKKVNDTFGHQMGDALLCEAGRRLRASVRSVDLVGRWGGDEFVIVADAGEAGASPQEVAELLTRRIHRQLAQASVTDSTGQVVSAVQLRASVGTTIGHAGSDAAALVHAADKAMYDTRTR